MHQAQLISGTTLPALRQANLACCSEHIRGIVFISSHPKINRFIHKMIFNENT